jgi:hypothetical protein
MCAAAAAAGSGPAAAGSAVCYSEIGRPEIPIAGQCQKRVSTALRVCEREPCRLSTQVVSSGPLISCPPLSRLICLVASAAARAACVSCWFSSENFSGGPQLCRRIEWRLDVDLLTAQLLSPHTAGDEQREALIDGANMSAESEMNSLCPRPRVRH